VHLDIKPDNMMISEDRKKCKIIDFGNAMLVEDIPRTSELVAGFYRAPEIILGMYSAPTVIFIMYINS
jgi:serine/threonine protein kinase